MKRALRGLTFRGKGLIAVGLGLGVGALISEQRDLLRIAILLLALPCVSVVLVARTHFRLGAERSVTPPQVPVGTVGEVQLTITNLSRSRTGTLLLSDALPPQLGPPVTRVFERVEAAGSRVTTYPLQAVRRGRYELGPLSITAVDPFGLVRLTRTFRTTTPVLVVPQIEELDDAVMGAEARGRGDGTSLALAARGDDDVVPREYRHGDDLRRIHWRASARIDELMVRREEVPWTNRATVLIDLRGPRQGGDGAASSLERTLSAGASAAVHLLRRGWSVRVITTDGRTLVTTASGAVGEAEVLTALSLVESWPAAEVNAPAVRDELVIAAVASDAGITAALAGRAARSAGQLGLALVTDTAAWFAPESLTADQTCATLRAAGWQAAVVTSRPASVAAAWRAAAADLRVGAR
ncbi:MAG: DUF58 domain-containing protein [Actinomycetota bacterium]